MDITELEQIIRRRGVQVPLTSSTGVVLNISERRGVVRLSLDRNILKAVREERMRARGARTPDRVPGEKIRWFMLNGEEIVVNRTFADEERERLMRER